MGKATFLVDMDGFDSGYGLYYREITALKAYLALDPKPRFFGQALNRRIESQVIVGGNTG